MCGFWYWSIPFSIACWYPVTPRSKFSIPEVWFQHVMEGRPVRARAGIVGRYPRIGASSRTFPSYAS